MLKLLIIWGIGIIVLFFGMTWLSILLYLKLVDWVDRGQVMPVRRYGRCIFWILYLWKLLGKHLGHPFFYPRIDGLICQYGRYISWILLPWELLGRYLKQPILCSQVDKSIQLHQNEMGLALIELQEHLFHDYPGAYSPLHTAAAVGNVAMLIPLLRSYPRSEFDVRLNAQTSYGYTPFQTALLFNQKRFLVELIRIGADSTTKSAVLRETTNLKCRRLLAALGLNREFEGMDWNQVSKIRFQVYFESSLVSQLLPWT